MEVKIGREPQLTYVRWDAEDVDSMDGEENEEIFVRAKDLFGTGCLVGC